MTTERKINDPITCDGTGKHGWRPLCGVAACMGPAVCNDCLKCRSHCGCAVVRAMAKDRALPRRPL
jgi:hypothetical protein